MNGMYGICKEYTDDEVIAMLIEKHKDTAIAFGEAFVEKTKVLKSKTYIQVH